ncbi:MAG TPA: PAS domain S-box protein [Pyrinomonadaceae bacterium]|jgi:PAS domain S-box-containing protein
MSDGKLNPEKSSVELSALEELRRRERELSDFIENASVGLHWVGADGTILWANQAELDLLGYTREEYIGRHIADFHADEEVIKDILTRLTRDETLHSYEARLRCKDGSIRYVLISSNVMRESGEFIHTRCFTRDITDRKRAEEALRANEEQFRAVAETALDSIITIDEESAILFANQSTQKIFGHALEELLGQPLTMLMPDYLRHLHEIGIKRYIETGEKHIHWGAVELPGLHKDGHEVPLEISFSEFVKNGKRQFTGIARDITERRRAAEALLERIRQAELNAAVGLALTGSDSLSDMLGRCAEVIVEQLDAALARIWTLNKKENVLELQASAGMYTHLDGPHGRVPVGQFKIGRIAEERRPHLTNQVVGDEQVSDQEWARREKMVAFAGYPLIVEDKIVGVMAMFARQPLTEATFQAMSSVANAVALGIERKRVEEELVQLLISEQKARQEAEAANRMKDEFLSTLSHELRTPLTAILGWTRMLSAGQVDEADNQRALETIERNAHAQSQLIEDILDVSRVISGKMRLEVRPLDLSTVIEAAVDTALPAAEAKGIRLQRVLDSGDSMVSGDPTRLQQVVWNLLSNAIKFTPKGGRVQIRLERINSHVEIIVTDNGQGISPDVLPHVFERFRQADSTTTRAHGGLGLGLAIVRHLVELHGGMVEAESAGPGQGATFTVKLPLIVMRSTELRERVKEERVHPTAGEVLPFQCPPELDGLHILVVDDEEDARTLITAILEKCAARVTAASSTEEGLALLKELRPDVLVSDLGMPEEDGYSLIRKVRALPAEDGGRTAAVALTAYARVEDRLKVLRAGFQTHLPKPVEPIELVAVIANLAGRVS